MSKFLGDKYKFYKKYLKQKLENKSDEKIMTLEEFYHDKELVREPTYSMEHCPFCGQRLEKDQSLKGCKGCNEFINGECRREGSNGDIGVCWMEKSEGEY